MYCGQPASLEPTTWRGLWATYLDPEGGNSRKKISTTPFQFYRKIVEGMEEECKTRVTNLFKNLEKGIEQFEKRK